MFDFLFRRKKAVEPEKTVVEEPKPAVDKTPAFLRPLYPYRAVGEALDPSRLDDPGYITMNWVLYELKCPNPDCVLNARAQGCAIKGLYEKIRDDSGCPSCKLQFGDKDAKGYEFKEGEIAHEVPINNGRWPGFIVKRVIFVPEDVFEQYAQKLYSKPKEQLARSESDAICEEYYKSGDWKAVDEAKIAEAKAKKAELDAKREEAIKKAEAEKNAAEKSEAAKTN